MMPRSRRGSREGFGIGLPDSPAKSVRSFLDVGPIPSLESDTVPNSPTCSIHSLEKTSVVGFDDSLVEKDKWEATDPGAATKAYLYMTNEISFEIVLTFYIAVLFVCTSAYIVFAEASPPR